jgi:hypothetical protein
MTTPTDTPLPTTLRLFLLHDHHPEEAFHRERFAGVLARTEGVAVVGESPAPGADFAGFGEAEVVLVLVGEQTWRSAAVDAQIAAATGERAGPRTALMGLVLRCYDYPALSARTPFGDPDLRPTEPRGQSWWQRNVPRRLYEQVSAGFAQMRPHPDPGVSPLDWIKEAAHTAARKTPAAARPVETADAEAGAVGWTGNAAHQPIVDAGAVKVST